MSYDRGNWQVNEQRPEELIKVVGKFIEERNKK